MESCISSGPDWSHHRWHPRRRDLTFCLFIGESQGNRDTGLIMQQWQVSGCGEWLCWRKEHAGPRYLSPGEPAVQNFAELVSASLLNASCWAAYGRSLIGIRRVILLTGCSVLTYPHMGRETSESQRRRANLKAARGKKALLLKVQLPNQQLTSQ